jgi:hypothetical protein
MKIGTVSKYINRKIVFIFVFQLLLIVTLLSYRVWTDTSIECIRCHSDKERMEQLGFPELYVTPEMVAIQSKHPNVQCHECHLGDGRAKDPDKAHRGMVSAIFVGHDGSILERRDIFRGALLPSGEDRIREMLPQVEINGELYPHWDVRTVLWGDRSRETFGYDPKIVEKTCGRSGCHPKELRQFNTTKMGTNFRQRTMRTWLEPYGPHNCSPSFADLPRTEVFSGAGFSFKNTEAIARELNVPFTKEQAIDKQKFCNVCHAGCLDCHYAPDREKGVHNFVRVPPSQSCAGFGRGTSVCHSGAMHSRRGGTYIGGDYSIPEGMEPDVHYKEGIHCVDCHITGIKGMGDIQRKASCQDCHIEIEEAHANSIHKNMDCAACHINELRGYQITIFGPGKVAGRDNPFKKYLYYGIQGPPILIKDQKGKWMPVKVWPHSVGNIKPDVKPSENLMFRWPDGETRDAYYVVGTFDAPANNKHLLWLELQQVSHPLGNARSCNSCHQEGNRQVTVSEWEFMDDQGAKDWFKGRYKIVADNKGLRITDLRNTTPIQVAEGYKLEDFASWVHFKDKWQMPGDFSIKVDKEKYDKYLSLSKKINRELKILEKKVKGKDRKVQRRFKELRGIVLHNPDGAMEKINEFKAELK